MSIEPEKTPPESFEYKDPRISRSLFDNINQAVMWLTREEILSRDLASDTIIKLDEKARTRGLKGFSRSRRRILTSLGALLGLGAVGLAGYEFRGAISPNTSLAPVQTLDSQPSEQEIQSEVASRIQQEEQNQQSQKIATELKKYIDSNPSRPSFADWTAELTVVDPNRIEAVWSTQVANDSLVMLPRNDILGIRIPVLKNVPTLDVNTGIVVRDYQMVGVRNMHVPELLILDEKQWIVNDEKLLVSSSDPEAVYTFKYIGKKGPTQSRMLYIKRVIIQGTDQPSFQIAEVRVKGSN